jgi:hypothetical protein
MSHILVDLDRTLAEYGHGDFHEKGPTYIGPPIPEMVNRVKAWLREGKEVRIFTARVAGLYVSLTGDANKDYKEATDQVILIRNWCKEHIGIELTVTAVKDWQAEVIYDDRAIQVIANKGRLINE